eukprot:CAMPEP_0174736778 /NCGR_PEP_ID=MMETSP1094-20130205/67245_1 /TAXON_ID=156173 /ORGANISM="Chrysochromulina brevifilum, Strain UTEX LB 985" /LENGTH=106 /DNA_ID=CAMNT_0015939925 /DNA_START=87 /DNA_END=403 /DNA_ORIENTATION=+
MGRGRARGAGSVIHSPLRSLVWFSGTGFGPSTSAANSAGGRHQPRTLANLACAVAVGDSKGGDNQLRPLRQLGPNSSCRDDVDGCCSTDCNSVGSPGSTSTVEMRA